MFLAAFKTLLVILGVVCLCSLVIFCLLLASSAKFTFQTYQPWNDHEAHLANDFPPCYRPTQNTYPYCPGPADEANNCASCRCHVSHDTTR